MANMITKEQNYALIIMVANEMGINVEMLDEAESIIKENKHVESCNILWFERAAIAAHEGVCIQGIDAIKEANKKAENIKKQYIYNRL